MRTRHALVGTLAGTALALGSMAVPAQAAPAAGGTAPKCIKRDVWYTDQGFWVALENTCTRAMSIQVIVKDGPSGPCFTLGKGYTAAPFFYEGTYARTAVC
ncbi:hypothetical protein [Streptomyces sp. NPDC056479]|uniref:hypothetical protein n=1 Tax=unclassified Streptomyces TaxID=2593676 RepID=UPI00369D8135